MKSALAPRRLFSLALAIALFATLACPPALRAQAQPPKAPFSTSWELFRVGEVPADGPARLMAVLWLTLDTGYHAYANPPGETGLATTLRLRTDASGPLLPVLYPPGTEEPDVFDPSMTVNTYSGTMPLFVPLAAPPGAPLALSGTLSLAACSDENCWPLRTDITLSHGGDFATLQNAEKTPWFLLYSALAQTQAALQASTESDSASTPEADPITEAQVMDAPAWNFTPRYFHADLEVGGLALALAFAFVAGFILNFMPCVLPVVSLKLSALMAGAAENDEAERTRAFREHNLFFSAGVLLYFLFLGGLIATLGLAWGQLFQSPRIVLSLALVVFALSLSLFGLFTLPIIDLKAGSGGKNPKSQALFTGILATLLATPCSGPFLGGVLGWVLLQTPEIILAVFLSIGLGMCSPFLLMTARPGLVRFLPRPGNWMRYLERGVGFFLLATCLYLLAILPREMLLPALALLWVVAFAAWMWGGWTNLSDSGPRRLTVRAVALALVLGAWFLLLAPGGPKAAWEPFEPAAFRAMLGREAVVLDFTADWCPNCKVLEHTTLAADNLGKWRERYGVRLVQVDMTRENPEQLALLRALGSQSIPLLAIFPSGKDSAAPVVLRDLFTTSQMDEALASALDQ